MPIAQGRYSGRTTSARSSIVDVQRAYTFKPTVPTHSRSAVLLQELRCSCECVVDMDVLHFSSRKVAGSITDGIIANFSLT